LPTGTVVVLDIERADPIVVLGILPRSGTNYLWDLLLLHPQCAPGRDPITEDNFLEASDDLMAFTRHVSERWDPMWGVFGDDLIPRLTESIGDGLLSFLWVHRDRRLVTKMPSVRNLDRFFTFFPRARLLILVRDGRSVVQSCMSTFGWEFDRAARSWASAADEIQRFRPSNDRFMLFRYEDLVSDVKGSMERILRFVGLDKDAFDFQAAADLPVRGSSWYFGPGRTSVHWDPVQKGPEFDPTGRWRSWTPEMHERFEWIAGPQLRAFGYDSSVAPVRAPGKVVRHRILDGSWLTKTTTRSVIYRARVRLGTATRPLRERLGLARSRS
jgi:protein-tyrosine sulfotransferase